MLCRKLRKKPRNFRHGLSGAIWYLHNFIRTTVFRGIISVKFGVVIFVSIAILNPFKIRRETSNLNGELVLF